MAAMLLAAPAWALVDERLPDPAAEARARALFLELRCMVCQNQSIDDSDAPLAKDLRMLVRERVKAGDSGDQIKEYLVARYGEFVLLRPRLSSETLLLWGAPVIVLVLGAGAAALAFRRRRSAGPAELSADEQKRLDAALQREV
ncbi:cytochrome c-type biogenesis protein [Terrihabitans sp. B22-R8]|uniref:cytochrome c-type biogenesis protein n=1 Tax=Terrihabitans sp. B22-R8 TaxID=3425128 RepID=UPI00403C5840